MNKKLKITLALGVATLLFTGCGGGSDTTTPPTSEGVTISGTLDTGLASSVTGIERGIFGSRTKMVVLTNGGNTNKTYDVATDGSFSIPTSEISGNDMVIIAVDDDTKEVLGNLKLSTTTDDKLDFVDKSKLANSLNFGTIDSSLNTNQTIANSNAFSSADVTTLQTVARADNALVLAQNKYRNPDFGTEVHAKFNMGTISDINGTWSSLTNFSENNHTGNSLGFSRDGTAWQSKNASDVKLYPPSTVMYGDTLNQTANATTPITSTGMNLPDEEEPEEFAFFDFPNVRSFPSGDWIMKLEGDNTIQAVFKFSGAEPFDANGKIKVPVPVVKINSSGGVVTTIEVKWYVHNGTAFVEASEELLNAIVGLDTHITGFAQFELNYGNNQEAGFYRNETAGIDRWNETYDLNSRNISVSLIDEISVSFPIGEQLNHKFFFGNN